jgi:hypothetical protein
MSDDRDIETVIQRLRAALDALEMAAERRIDGDVQTSSLADQLHALAVDRSRLADDLDNASARSKRLETANREIADRLDIAISSIRSVIAVKEQ